jgi:hypothetical protein
MLTNPDPHLQWQIPRASWAGDEKLPRISPHQSSPNSGRTDLIHLLFLRIPCCCIYNPCIDFI